MKHPKPIYDKESYLRDNLTVTALKKAMTCPPEATPPTPGSITEAIDRLNRMLGELGETTDALQKRLGIVLRPSETCERAMPDGVRVMPCELASSINCSANIAESILIQVNDISTRLEL